MRRAALLVGMGAWLAGGGCGGKVADVAIAAVTDAAPPDAATACAALRCVIGSGVVLRPGELEDTWIRCGGKEDPSCGALTASYDPNGCLVAHVDGASDASATLRCVVDWLSHVPRACADGTVRVARVCP